MRKLILFICIYITVQTGYAQVWETVGIDSGITVSLPKGFQKKDSLTDFSITARTGFGNILITKTADNPSRTPDIYKKRHLDNYYDNYVRNIGLSSHGSVTDEKDTTLGKVRVKDFTLHLSSAGGKKSRKFRIIHENSATYTFQFLYDDITGNVAASEIDQFFNSIKLVRDFDLQSQFTEVPEGGRRTGMFNMLNIGIGVVAVLIVIWLMAAARKRRQKQRSGRVQEP